MSRVARSETCLGAAISLPSALIGAKRLASVTCHGPTQFDVRGHLISNVCLRLDSNDLSVLVCPAGKRHGCIAQESLIQPVSLDIVEGGFDVGGNRFQLPRYDKVFSLLVLGYTCQRHGTSSQAKTIHIIAKRPANCAL